MWLHMAKPQAQARRLLQQRANLAQQQETTVINTSTALGLALTPYLENGDKVSAESVIKAVFDGGKRLNSPQLRLFALVRAEATEPRLGIAVSKKVDKRAVGRNRIKRMARELFRRERATLPAGDFVLIAQPGAKSVPMPELRAQFAQLLERARSLKPLPPTGTMPASAEAPARPHPNPVQES